MAGFGRMDHRYDVPTQLLGLTLQPLDISLCEVKLTHGVFFPFIAVFLRCLLMFLLGCIDMFNESFSYLYFYINYNSIPGVSPINLYHPVIKNDRYKNTSIELVRISQFPMKVYHHSLINSLFFVLFFRPIPIVVHFLNVVVIIQGIYQLFKIF